MGGKSRKGGGVSKRLINHLKASKKSCGSKNKTNESIFKKLFEIDELDEESGSDS